MWRVLARTSILISYGAIFHLIAMTIIQTHQFAHQIVYKQIQMISTLYSHVYLVVHATGELIFGAISALLVSSLRPGMRVDAVISNF